jgi:diadenylate cyclase
MEKIVDQEKGKLEFSILQASQLINQAINIKFVFVIANDLEIIHQVKHSQSFIDQKIIWGTSNEDIQEHLQNASETYIWLPYRYKNIATEFSYYIVSAYAQQLINPEEFIILLGATQDSKFINQIQIIRPIDEYELIRYINTSLMSNNIGSLISTINVALTMANVRHGTISGTMFTIGDSHKILQMSRHFVFEPFHAYPREKRNISDPSIRSTLEKYTRLDGAFVISEDGTIEEIVTTINPPQGITEVMPGLGSRHTAANAISNHTSAFVVTVSQSGGNVSVFKEGKVILSLKNN